MKRLTSPRVLIAEDHSAMRAKIESILSRDFLIVGNAETGPGAFDLATELNPDVLVIDVFMPLLDGREVVRRLRELGSKTKIVFVSVSLAADMATSCLSAGGDAFVTKMRMASDLVTAIRNVLAGGRCVTFL